MLVPPGADGPKGNGGRPATGSIVWADPETKTKPIGVRVTKANRIPAEVPRCGECC